MPHTHPNSQELISHHSRSPTQASAKWSEVFARLEEAKVEMNFEDYGVTQTSLEQVSLYTYMSIHAHLYNGSV